MRIGNFSEGLNIDYRYFLANNITPRFAFGYGLTYTNFTYSILVIIPVRGSPLSSLPPDANSTSPVPVGGLASLFKVIALVNCTITNTGSVPAAEVAQLYVGIPGAPARQLRGFRKTLIPPGKNVHVGFELTRRDLSIWDVTSQNWRLQLNAKYQIYVGASVLDIRLNRTLSL
jgi:beta-glucosidase